MSRVEVGRPSDVDVLVAGGEADAPRRRWPLWALTLVLAVAGVAVNRPELSLYADPPTPLPSAAEAQRSARLGAVPWPARGDLVRDRAFIGAALDRIRAERPGVARVHFAGRLPDGSRLVLAGTDVIPGRVATPVYALHVPAGAPIEESEVSEQSALVDLRQVLAWAARGRNGSVHVVALTRPGPVRFFLSARVDVDPVAGSPTRHWAPAAATDGVVVADLGPAADPIVGVRASGTAVFTLPLLVRVAPHPLQAPAGPKVQS